MNRLVVRSCIHLLDYLFMQYIRGWHRPSHDLHILIFIATMTLAKLPEILSQKDALHTHAKDCTSM